jgi:hypothetical protein
MLGNKYGCRKPYPYACQHACKHALQQQQYCRQGHELHACKRVVTHFTYCTTSTLSELLCLCFCRLFCVSHGNKKSLLLLCWLRMLSVVIGWFDLLVSVKINCKQ